MSEPLVPAEVDLRDFAFTPIFRAKLFGSSFHARTTDSEWRAGVTLWLKSWDQVPAGSLPDDEIDLCRLAELGRDLKAWRRVRVGAMRGWAKCSDGRLYHRVVADGVLEAWAKRTSAKKKGIAGASARWGTGSSTGIEPAIAEAMPGDSKGREGKGIEGSLNHPSDDMSGSSPDAKRLNGKAQYVPAAESVLSYLNQTTGRAFEFRAPNGDLTANADTIIARLKEGYTAEQLREVVLLKSGQWRGDEKMDEYLRPATLFGKQKFQQYLGDLGHG